jgi:hypothetical protein
MTWLSRRRSSGEIINATLIEVFLALVFIVFCLAVFEQKKLREVNEQLVGVLGPAETESLRDSLKRALDSLTVARGVAARRLDSLATARAQLFVSKYPPDCEPLANPSWIVTVDLLGPNHLSIVAHRPVAALTPGERIDATLRDFETRFAQVRDIELKQGCKFFAKVNDTPGTSKADWKLALSVISSVFRTNGAYR